MIVGTAAVLAVAAVIALAIGTMLRRSAGAVAAVIVVIVLPYLLTVTTPLLPAGPTDWLARVTPAAAFAVQQTLIAYPQVSNVYAPSAGYYPLAPWAGFAVLCAWAAVALALAVYAEPEGRMNVPCLRVREVGARWDAAGTRTFATALRAEWTKLRTLAGTWWLLLAVIALTAAVGAAPRVRGDLPGRGLRAGPGQGRPVRHRPQPGGRGHPGGARDQRRVQHRHDPHHADRDAAPAERARRQGGRADRADAGGGHGRGARVGAGRAADPARPRVHPAARLPAAVAGQRPGPARGGRLGPLPGADRPARARRRHRRPRLGGVDRAGARPALPVPGHRQRPRARTGHATCSRSAR